MADPALPSAGSLYQVRDHREWVVGAARSERIAQRVAGRLKGSVEEFRLRDILTPSALAAMDKGTLIYVGDFDDNGKKLRR